jgi:hypothetical protein
MSTTAKGYGYPQGADAATLFPAVALANANLNDARPGVSVVTTTQMNAYTGTDLWDGRVVWNTTTVSLMRYNLGTTTWVAITSVTSFSGTAANRATVVPTPVLGNVYWATDTSVLSIYTGAAWLVLLSGSVISGVRVTRRVLALAANSATPAVNTDNYDVVHITSQVATITTFTMTGTPIDGDILRISITSAAIVSFTLGTLFESSGTQTIPTATVAGVRLDMVFVWNTETTKWRYEGGG